MHDYLRAIGFSQIKSRREFLEVVDLIIEEPSGEYITKGLTTGGLGEKYKLFGDKIGIVVRGEYNKDGIFDESYCFPYLESPYLTLDDDVVIEKYPDKYDFAGVCEDINLGVALIFHLLNMIDYVDYLHQKKSKHQVREITLTAMSTSGTILLPILKDKVSQSKDKISNKIRNNMILAAKQGDQEAIDNLTIEDIDLYSSITKRAKSEDVYTIVKSYVMPYGISSEEYSVLGEIIDVSETINEVTKEEIYILRIECNEIAFDLCINKMDLTGEPSIGRRFKGNIWMQGYVNFAS